jgi:hypothetical protein
MAFVVHEDVLTRHDDARFRRGSAMAPIRRHSFGVSRDEHRTGRSVGPARSYLTQHQITGILSSMRTTVQRLGG